MADLPPLPTIDSIIGLDEPIPKIKTEEDVHSWKTTSGFQNYALFIQRLNEAVVGRSLDLQEQPTEVQLIDKHQEREIHYWHRQ